MEFVISAVGAERIMLGSDYCYNMGYDRPIEFLDQLDLNTTQRAMILGGNGRKAVETLRLIAPPKEGTGNRLGLAESQFCDLDRAAAGQCPLREF